MPKKNYLNVINKYNKTKMKLYSFRFHVAHQADIIEHLESQPNKAGYIANLIRQDLIAQGKQPYVKLLVKDLAKQIDNNDRVILLFSDDSKLITDKAHIINDNRVVNCYEKKEYSDHNDWIIEVRYS